jgi:putative transcriptional regulator
MSNSIKFHPASALLIEFSAGNLAIAPSICVSAHLHFCRKCRDELLRLDQVGSQIMDKLDAAPIADGLLDTVMAKIDNPSTSSTEKKAQKNVTGFPSSINILMKDLQSALTWRRLSPSIDISQFQTGQAGFEVALHRIRAGGMTPKHDHEGSEYTVVLKGSFSDENAVYQEGDFLFRRPGDVHQPMGSQNGECICLSALSAPIKLSHPLGFLMKPWLRINPM